MLLVRAAATGCVNMAIRGVTSPDRLLTIHSGSGGLGAKVYGLKAMNCCCSTVS